MLLKFSCILLFVFVCRVSAGCTDIPNEDKIDCAQHISWNEASCLAKGCCHVEVAGYPACYYPYPNKHLAECSMSVSERHDCGNAQTTEIECINGGCCWQMTPGAPFCYHKKGGDVTDNPVTVATDSPVTDNPSGSTEVHTGPKCQVSTLDRKECGNGITTADSCEDKGCCWQMTPGAPSCYHKNGGDGTDSPVTVDTDSPVTVVTDSPVTDDPSGSTEVHSNPGAKCQVSPLDRKECGNGITTALSCENKGCCWQMTPGAPFCFNASS